MGSIRGRLMLLLATGFGVLMLGLGLGLERFLTAHATGSFDDALIARARSLVALTDQEGGRIEFDYSPEHMPEFERAERPEHFQFWREDGTVAFRSGRLWGDLPRGEPGSREPRVRDVRLPDGRPGRMVELTFHPRHGEHPGDDDEDTPSPGALHAGSPVPDLVLVVARGREPLDALVGRMRAALLGTGGLAILLAVLLVWLALASGLRPLEAIAARVRRLDAETMDQRVGPRPVPRELVPIVEQIDALLGRLSAAFERERRFTGNVAHELRTPIAELRSLAAVGARWPDDASSVVGFFGDVGEIAGRMERVIADLLLLARCQAGVETALGARTEVRQLLESAWARLDPVARQRGVRLRLEVPEDLVIESDPEKLDIVFFNVLGNAVSHGRPGGEIRCDGSLAGGRFHIEVSNPAEPLGNEALQRLTEPFWSGSAARSPEQHAGLGLALVDALAALLSLDLRLEQGADGTFRVRLEGPALDGGRAGRRARSSAIPKGRP